MKECKNCGATLLSTELQKCRDCIITQHEEVIQEIVENIKDQRLRELSVIHTEVRNRLYKEENNR